MGRYYSGDIDGKFWVAVQSSDDAGFFGGTVCEPEIISYYFDEDDLSDVEKGVNECEEKLGEFKNKLDKFFERNGGYNNEKISKELNITPEKVQELLEWYARLELGVKIRDCLREKGVCKFDAEL